MTRLRERGFARALLALLCATALAAPRAALAEICIADCDANLPAGKCPTAPLGDSPPLSVIAVADAIRALNYAAGVFAQPGAGTDAAINCNVNASGTVDVGDAVMILRWRAGELMSFPDVNNRWDIMAWDSGVWGN
ncbi:MAG: hypothetical protein K8I02_06120 [Candidatus Methylomirabilis sp.]|nr:hypothetical protein [Deltaproteobacteria bacterium]